MIVSPAKITTAEPRASTATVGTLHCSIVTEG
jgi:hypothetical protein